MVRVAVVGCAHGMLDDIFATVRFINEMDAANPVELLLCCGDFECMRNSRDLANLACPPKYREMHSFHQYYKGEKTAPVLTLFIGGNHEASNYLSELHYGGWVAPNIFYLGAAGVVNVAGLRIGGLSGIYKHQDYTAGRFERAPFDNSTMRSVYHVRELEVFQLSHVQMQDRTKLSAFLSHDWPRGIEQFGDVRALVRRKPFFQQEIQSNTLGSPAGEFLLFQLQPQHWFAAHLHVKFAALVRHAPPAPAVAAAVAAPATQSVAPGEDATESTSSENPPAAATSSGTITSSTGSATAPVEHVTKFLALDKCLPRREFLQVLNIPSASTRAGCGDATSTTTTSTTATSTTDISESTSNSAPASATAAAAAERPPLKVLLDFEWLAVLRATHHLASANKFAPRVPQEELRIEAHDIAWVRSRYREFVAEKALDRVDGEWLSDFAPTAPAFGDAERAWDGRGFSGNPQTDLLLEFLKLPHVVTSPYVGGSGAASAVAVDDPNAIDLDDDDEEDDDDDGDSAARPDAAMSDTTGEQVQHEAVPTQSEQPPTAAAPADPNELDIDM